MSSSRSNDYDTSSPSSERSDSSNSPWKSNLLNHLKISNPFQFFLEPQAICPTPESDQEYLEEIKSACLNIYNSEISSESKNTKFNNLVDTVWEAYQQNKISQSVFEKIYAQVAWKKLDIIIATSDDFEQKKSQINSLRNAVTQYKTDGRLSDYISNQIQVKCDNYEAAALNQTVQPTSETLITERKLSRRNTSSDSSPVNIPKLDLAEEERRIEEEKIKNEYRLQKTKDKIRREILEKQQNIEREKAEKQDKNLKQAKSAEIELHQIKKADEELQKQEKAMLQTLETLRKENKRLVKTQLLLVQRNLAENDRLLREIINHKEEELNLKEKEFMELATKESRKKALERRIIYTKQPLPILYRTNPQQRASVLEAEQKNKELNEINLFINNPLKSISLLQARSEFYFDTYVNPAKKSLWFKVKKFISIKRSFFEEAIDMKEQYSRIIKNISVDANKIWEAFWLLQKNIEAVRNQTNWRIFSTKHNNDFYKRLLTMKAELALVYPKHAAVFSWVHTNLIKQLRTIKSKEPDTNFEDLELTILKNAQVYVKGSLAPELAIDIVKLNNLFKPNVNQKGLLEKYPLLFSWLNTKEQSITKQYQHEQTRKRYKTQTEQQRTAYKQRK